MYHPKKLQLRNQIPLKQKPFHLRKKRILTRIFHRKISNLLTDSEKDPFTGEKKSFHHHIFHTAKELNYLREKYILEKIPDDQLLEYLKLEEKRHELQVQERNIREKRIMNAFMLTVILAAIVAVVYSLHENPTVLISILYIGGILAGIHVWNKKK